MTRRRPADGGVDPGSSAGGGGASAFACPPDQPGERGHGQAAGAAPHPGLLDTGAARAWGARAGSGGAAATDATASSRNSRLGSGGRGAGQGGAQGAVLGGRVRARGAGVGGQQGVGSVEEAHANVVANGRRRSAVQASGARRRPGSGRPPRAPRRSGEERRRRRGFPPREVAAGPPRY